MDTSCRKRADLESSSAAASTQTPTRSAKKPRVPSPVSSPFPTRPRQSLRLMDSASESSGSAGWRAKNKGAEREREVDKGKEKEPEFAFSSRHIERSLGLSIGDSEDNIDDDDDDDDDDNDDEDDDEHDGEGGFGNLHQNLTSASSALQGLLRKLGAGLDDWLPSYAMAATSSSVPPSGKLKKILYGLRADGEEGKQIEALTQLCDVLLIGTDDSLGVFPVESFVPVLVELLNYESNVDVMLLAARALTHLCDVLPSSCGMVVHYGAVPCFCSRLLNIEYMDLAEQSLQALRKISQEHPAACLRAGALMAVLSFLDFFPTGVQRVALATAANMCKKLPSDAANFVMKAVPLLTNLLQYHDSNVLEHSCTCLIRIVEAFASSPEKLDELSNHGLVAQAASLISISNSGSVRASLSKSTYTGLIRLLSICANGSPMGAKTLFLLGISGMLKDILSSPGSGSGSGSGSCSVGSFSVSPALTKPPDQIFEIVNLADVLLPSLPEGSISLPTYFSIQKKSSVGKQFPANGTGKLEDSHGTLTEISAREKLLRDQPELLQQFGMELLPVLLQVYGSTVNVKVRHKCLSVIGKLMYFSTADMILSILSAANIASFLAAVLASKDSIVLIPALQMAEILMEKLPTTFFTMFLREGVIHAVDSLISSDLSNPVAAKFSIIEEDNDSVCKTSHRSRYYRQQIGCLNPIGSSLEKPKDPASVNIDSPLATEQISTINSSSQEPVIGHAKVFKNKYFSSGPGEAEVGVTDELLRLKKLCGTLNSSVDDQKARANENFKTSGSYFSNLPSDKEDHIAEVISSVLKELSREDSVSTFEFIGSGVVAALLNYFSIGTFSSMRTSNPNLLELRQQAMRRFRLFIAVALPLSIDNGMKIPMTVLARKLQDALSSLEHFPVVLSHSSMAFGGNAHSSSGLTSLSKPLKLRLCRHQNDKSLRDFSSNIVLIDPMTSLAAVEKFLWPRVHQGESNRKTLALAQKTESGTPIESSFLSCSTSMPASSTRRHSTRSNSYVTIGGPSLKCSPVQGSGSSLKRKGKSLLASTQNQARGSLTRNAALRGASSEKNLCMKPVCGDSISEDEFDVSPVKIDDALVIEEDDLSDYEDDDHEDVLRNDVLVYGPEKVHDVKLGKSTEDVMGVSGPRGSNNPASGSNRTASTLRRVDFENTSDSKGTISSAAAAATDGFVFPNARGFRSGRDRLGLDLVGGSNDPPKLIFSAGGKQLSKNMTLYQAVQCQLVLDENDEETYNSEMLSSDGVRLWGDLYTITYQRADSQIDGTLTGITKLSHSKHSKAGSAFYCNLGSQFYQISLLDSILQGEFPCDLEKTDPTYNVLQLLRVLSCVNQLAPHLRAQTFSDNFSEGKILSFDEWVTTSVEFPPEEFINSKLANKLSRQICDPLALCSGNHPSWCYHLTKACPFLFPFQTRRQYFNLTAFGLSHALHWLQLQQGADGHGSGNGREVRVGKLQRQKVRVSRNQILDSALKVMEMYSSQNVVLEVEYFGEVGTGLGPTLEFYTLLSHDLQKVGLGIWRSSSNTKSPAMEADERYGMLNGSLDGNELGPGSAAGCGDLIQAPLGLFPRPWPPTAEASGGSQFSKVLEYFRMVGQVMAKALQDGRLLDLPLSTSFYKLMLGQELDLHDIMSFDAELGKSLYELQAIVCRKRYLDSTAGHKCEANSNLCFYGVPIEDLCLDFSLPGYPDYILKPDYNNFTVDINNLGEYIALVVDATVKSGVIRQLEAFRDGFNQVFDISALQIFFPHELDYLLCGHRELWEVPTLTDHIKFDHGYTAKSPVIVNLLQIMGEFTPEQQRAFCRFVTGAPRLPPGGLAALNPKLTIVKKHSYATTNTGTNGTGSSESVDDDLPSVMTCANYLKLPPYSTKEILYKKLLFAIEEGQGSFDLS